MMAINYLFVAVRSNWASVTQQRRLFCGLKDLGVKPFKIQLVQELKPNDLPQCRSFGEWALGKLAEDPLRSCDLTPLDYFLWGYVKAHVYTDKLTHCKTTLKHLYVTYRPKCWKEYAEIGLSGWII